MLKRTKKIISNSGIFKFRNFRELLYLIVFILLQKTEQAHGILSNALLYQ